MSCRSHPFTHNSVKYLTVYRQATLLKDALASQNEFRDEVEGRRGRVKRKKNLFRGSEHNSHLPHPRPVLCSTQLPTVWILLEVGIINVTSPRVFT